MRLLQFIASRRITPVILTVFLAIYVAAAFVGDEALATLMALTQRNVFLLCLLFCVPLNIAARLLSESSGWIGRRRALHGKTEVRPGMFDEETVMSGGDLAGVADRLGSAGYRLHRGEGVLGAFRGYSAFPARMLFLCGALLLSLGIFLSLSLRNVVREAVVEGEPLPPFLREVGRVVAIELRELHGAHLLARDLVVSVASDGTTRRFGLYPPGSIAGFFLYPRFLGVAPLVQFSAPDLPRVADYYLLMLYPPGREDSAQLAGTPYRISFRLLETQSGEDPYVTGAFSFSFRIEKAGQVVAQGTVPAGGAFSGNGFRLALPDARRIVTADFVRDPGVPLIWLAFLLLPLSLLVYLPVRLLNPRREILLIRKGERVVAHGRAEGRRARHAGVFHEILDMLAKDYAGKNR